MECEHCGKPLTGRQSRFCGINCKTYVGLRNWRRRTKAGAVKVMGGKCQRCGYSKCYRSMIFHHPGEKSYGIGGRCSWAQVERELKKCILLCLNCHGEEHCEDEGCEHV